MFLFLYFFLIKNHEIHGSKVLITHRSTPAKAAFIDPQTAIAHVPRTPTSAIGTFGVTATTK